jgi:ketol-acid reductoisomerase
MTVAGYRGMDEARIYYDEDADLSVLEGRTLAVLGYGNWGSAMAKNLRDTGVGEVIVGNRDDEYREQATADGFDVVPIREAAARGDVLFMMIPDEVAPTVYESDIAPGLEDGDLLDFASGYNITYDLISPPSDVDVVMVAPRVIGSSVRELYLEDEGFPSMLAIEQDHTGDAEALCLGIAKALGSTTGGVVETTFDLETKLNLLAEQALWPLFHNALFAYYDVAMEEGAPPAPVFMELHLSGALSFVFELMREQGLMEQLALHSPTSRYGQLSRIEDVDREEMRTFMRDQLDGIRDASFAKEFAAEQELGKPTTKRLLKEYRSSGFVEDEQAVLERLELGEASRE